MEKIRTSFSNSGNLLKVQYTGLVGFGCLQLAMNCVQHSQYGFIIIFHLLSRQLYSRDCMKVYETHTKVLARKISDASIQQLKKRNKNKRKINFSKDLASTEGPLWANLGTHTLKHETCGKRVSRYPFSLSHNPSLGRIVWQAKGAYAWETSEWNSTPLPHFDNVVIHFITTVWQDGLPYVIAGENKEQLLHITRTLFSF